MYLVYQHRKADTNEIFYVGESTIRRIRNGITYWDVK